MAQQVTKEQIKDVYGSTIFGDIDAGKLTGTLPAIDGSNLTGLSTGGSLYDLTSTTTVLNATSSTSYSGSYTTTVPGIYKISISILRGGGGSVSVSWSASQAGFDLSTNTMRSSGSANHNAVNDSSAATGATLVLPAGVTISLSNGGTTSGSATTATITRTS